MFRSKSSMQKHTNKHITKTVINRFSIKPSQSHNDIEAHMQTQTLGQKQKPTKPPFHSFIHHNSSPSTSGHAQSSRSQPLSPENVSPKCSPLSKRTSSESTLDSENYIPDEYEMKLLEEVEIIDEQGNILRTQKMSTKDVFRLKEFEKILVHINEFHTLITMWKDMVDEWVSATTKMTVSEATPESMNPSVVDEEEGLPSPPLDDLAFLNPHTMSLELNEFFDGMDDYGNPRNNGRKPVQRNNGGKPPAEKQNVTKWKQQKSSNGPTMVPKPSVVKPRKHPVADSTPGRVMKPNMDRKMQSPETTTPLKRPVAPQQRKPTSTNEEPTQDKLEATKGSSQKSISWSDSCFDTYYRKCCDLSRLQYMHIYVCYFDVQLQ